MSKCIKLEDAIEAYNQAVTLLVESEMEEFNLGDFTECSFNTTQIKLIARMIGSLPTIEVSEDCISRADLLKTIDDNVSQQYSDTYETYGLDLWALFVRIVKNAPSVVPSRAEGEWITEQDSYEIICSNCESEAFSEYGEWFKSDYCPNCGAKMKGAE